MLEILYGGSFDPVHNGHLAVARNARDAIAARVLLMPAADPPHKGPLHADARQRLAMLELAIDGERGLGIEACELGRDGPSYTVDTLRLLRATRVGDAPLAILVGADSFLSLPTWKQWRSLFDLAHIVVAERGGSGFEPSALGGALAAATAGRWAHSAEELHRLASGLVLRLKGKGVPNLQGYGAGDQHVRLRIEVPDRLDRRQREMLHELAESCGDENFPGLREVRRAAGEFYEHKAAMDKK